MTTPPLDMPTAHAPAEERESCWHDDGSQGHGSTSARQFVALLRLFRTQTSTASRRAGMRRKLARAPHSTWIWSGVGITMAGEQLATRGALPNARFLAKKRSKSNQAGI